MEISWKFNGNSLDELHDVSSSTIGKRGSFLAIEPVSYEHAGNYSCLARNKAGAEMHTAQLNVNGIKLLCMLLCKA